MHCRLPDRHTPDEGRGPKLPKGSDNKNKVEVNSSHGNSVNNDRSSDQIFRKNNVDVSLTKNDVNVDCQNV